jgi:hypothetical protein
MNDNAQSKLEPQHPEDPRTEIATSAVLHAAPALIWERLLFYEQIDQPPPLHLRLLLPVPIETVGPKARVGDEAKCLYQSGHLVKRVTHVELGSSYEFEVVEQMLDVGGGMRLKGGRYALSPLAEGGTEVRIVTRYTSPKRPRWLWQPIETAVCHSFHRHILRAMSRDLARSEAMA